MCDWLQCITVLWSCRGYNVRIVFLVLGWFSFYFSELIYHLILVLLVLTLTTEFMEMN